MRKGRAGDPEERPGGWSGPKGARDPTFTPPCDFRATIVRERPSPSAPCPGAAHGRPRPSIV